MKRSRPVSLALVGLFLWLTGCTSWTPIGISEVADHERVRVTLVSGEQQTLHQPQVEDDSIRGVSEEMANTLGPQRSADALPTPYALEDVAGIEAVESNEVGTFLTVFGIVAVGIGLIYAVAIVGSW